MVFLDPYRAWLAPHLVTSDGGKTHLACKDDDLIDDSGSFILQELTDDEATRGASTNNSKVLVAGHVLVSVEGLHAYSLLFNRIVHSL
jgi:hypothetical protein